MNIKITRTDDVCEVGNFLLYSCFGVLSRLQVWNLQQRP